MHMQYEDLDAKSIVSKYKTIGKIQMVACLCSSFITFVCGLATLLIAKQAYTEYISGDMNSFNDTIGTAKIASTIGWASLGAGVLANTILGTVLFIIIAN